MYTFSQLVDEIVSEVRRPDLTSEISRYLNQSIRECHADPETNAIVFFPDNRRELQVLSAGESSHTWQIPRVTNFQKMAGVLYPNTYRNSEAVWPMETTPGRHLAGETYYYYRVGSTFVFSGMQGIGTPINLLWYEFPSSLPYFATPEDRPMQYNIYGGKEYAPAWVHEEDRDDADLLTTNWLLERWGHTIAEGVRAKVYKRTSDTERARTSYSLYAQLRRNLITSEISVIGVF